MTCGPVPTTFRIFGRDAEWQRDFVADGAVIDDTIELQPIDPAAADPRLLVRAMPPPWIARGCDPCMWYLLTPPDRRSPALLQVAPCAGSVAALACRAELIAPTAVAATRDLVAVLDPGRGEVLVLSPGGDRVVTEIATRARGPIAFMERSVLVADGAELVAHAVVGGARRRFAAAPGPIERLAVAGGTIWAAIASAGSLAVVRLFPTGWQPATVAELTAVARDSGISAAGDHTVCLQVPRDDRAPCTVCTVCIDRCGRRAPAPPAEPPPQRRTTAVLTTRAPIDSGIPRCRWHRMRIELELPERSGLEISLATIERPDAAIADHDWQVIDAGPITQAPPHGATATVCDFLITQPPGRYLALRLALRGDGSVTPRLRRIRIDFPRSTSAARLPGIYRDDPVSADFLERFIALFDASIDDLDRVITRFPALIDPSAAPAEALPWLASFLDIALDPAWPEAMRRAILDAAPALYRDRGTARALTRAIELITGATPAIHELGGPLSPFGRLGTAPGAGTARIGQVRLFGRARARLRLGASALGAAPLHSYGDPDRDHVTQLGWRIVVQVPGGAVTTPEAMDRLRRLVDAQKPAHVAATVRVGAERGLVGIDCAVGIDTRLRGLPVSYLGTDTQLRRHTVLARGARRGGARLAVGTASVLAIHTVLS